MQGRANISSRYVSTTYPCLASLPHTQASQLTMVHDVHAQPQQCPGVSSCVGQQAAEHQTQDPQHGSTCAMGPELGAAHQVLLPMEIPHAIEQTGPL